MNLKNIVQLVGDYHHVEVSPDAHLDLGADITIRSFASIEVSSGANLKVGNRVFFNDHCSIRCTEEIIIGHDTMFGDGVRIFDSNHQFNNYHVFKTAMSGAPIHIGRD
nr:hypothetical protein [Streptococcus mitis]